MMRALTIHQPYASLIADGRKKIETRSWPPPPGLIGERIAIHAGRNRGPTVRAAIKHHYPGFGVPRPYDAGDMIAHHSDGRTRFFPLGKIIATAVLLDAAQVIETPYESDNRLARVASMAAPEHRWIAKVDRYGDFSAGRWLFMLSDVLCIAHPLFCNGFQKFWRVHPEFEAALS